MRRYHLHMPGVIFCGLTLLVALAAMNSQNNLLFWLFGMLCSAMIMSGLVSGVMMMRLRFRRLDPHYGTVGEPLLVRYTIENRSRFLPAFNLHVEELTPVNQQTSWHRLMDIRRTSNAWIMHVGPKETVHGEAVFWPRARGEARFDRVRIWTTFPFGIIKKSVTRSQPQHTLIYPQLYELRPDLLRAVSPPALIGNRTIIRPGPPDAGDEYFGLREHRANDNIRSIAWKRSAHLDQLVCIERSMPSPPKLRIVLNLTVATASLPMSSSKAASSTLAARELEERAIMLAASIAHLAHHEGLEISFTALGTRTPRIGMRRSHWHLHKIMAALASLDLDAPRDEAAQEPVVDADRAGVVVIHPDRVGTMPQPVGRGEALHVTGRQLETLAVRPIGWNVTDESARGESTGATTVVSKEAAA